MGTTKRDKKQSNQRERAKGGGFVPILCNVLGVALLLVVVGLCAPLVVPSIVGYQAYEVVSGSMEPEIPVGSVIYVQDVDLTKVQEGDIIAFNDGNSVIAHRVTTNRTSLGEFVTKGDSNEIEDFDPIPYDAVIGKVQAHVPYLGSFMSIYTSTVGKVYLLLTAACGVMFNVLASRIRERRRRVAAERELRMEQAQRALDTVEAGRSGSADEQAALGSESNSTASRVASAPGSAGGAKPRAAKRGSAFDIVRRALIIVLAVVFLGSAGVIGFVNYQYSKSDALYSKASETYTRAGDAAPITIDFDSLCAENPDIVGWIYCEGTPINYPVLQGKDNDQYLYTDYTGSYNIDGSIFVDGDNRPGFADSNTIIYGHHMNSGSMFACLEKWTDQAFYEEHPVVWLLTPTQDYQIVLFAGHHVNAYSENYDIISGPGPELDSVLAKALEESDFDANATIVATSSGTAATNGNSAMQADSLAAAPADDSTTLAQGEAASGLIQSTPSAAPGEIQLNPLRDHYVMLSTCAYVFDNARYALHGVLVPASTAGGKPLA